MIPYTVLTAHSPAFLHRSQHAERSCSMQSKGLNMLTVADT